MGFDFGIISETRAKFFDNDLMTVSRRMLVPVPNRPPVMQFVEIYTDLPCYFDYKQSDNPNPQTVDTRPINVTGIVYCDESIELLNADKLTIKKMANNGTILEIYSGEIGKPSLFQSRQQALLTIGVNI